MTHKKHKRRTRRRKSRGLARGLQHWLQPIKEVAHSLNSGSIGSDGRPVGINKSNYFDRDFRILENGNVIKEGKKLQKITSSRFDYIIQYETDTGGVAVEYLMLHPITRPEETITMEFLVPRTASRN
ncbi:MAG: hypothetical protein NT000_02645 [Proteobacteria bacterium]|nr:hypothetical protein [Pseudomonadota bacterium]